MDPLTLKQRLNVFFQTSVKDHSHIHECFTDFFCTLQTSGVGQINSHIVMDIGSHGALYVSK